MNPGEVTLAILLDSVVATYSTFEEAHKAFLSLGAAAQALADVIEAVGPSAEGEYGQLAEDLLDLIPGTDQHVPCPGCSGQLHSRAPVWVTVTTLNDHHQWSRERIADWLETLDLDLTIEIPDPTAGSVTEGEKQ